LRAQHRSHPDDARGEPRAPAGVPGILEARRDGGPFDQAEYERVLRQSVIDVVRNQADAGIDIVTTAIRKSIHWAAYV